MDKHPTQQKLRWEGSMTEKRVPRYPAPPPRCACGRYELSSVPSNLHAFTGCLLGYDAPVAAPPQEGRTPAPPEIEGLVGGLVNACHAWGAAGDGPGSSDDAYAARTALLSAIGRALSGEREGKLRETRQAHAMWERMEDAHERADAAEAALTKERAEHINDVKCGERRLMACEKKRDEMRRALAERALSGEGARGETLAAHVLHFASLMEGVELRFDMHARLRELALAARALAGAPPETGDET